MEELDDPEVLALTSPEFVDVRLEFGMARAEIAAESIARQTAELWSAAADVLDDAERHPEFFIDERAQLSALERRDYAVRSAVADLAARLVVAEGTVRAWGDAARTLRRGAPRTWAAFGEGRVTPANARTVADLLADLPADAHEAFDAAVAERAGRLAPARFRAAARAARERVHRDRFEDRHRRAMQRRRFSIENEVDGMSWINIHLPTEVAIRAALRVDAAARSLVAVPGETLTLDQARADVAGELLTSTSTGATATAVSVAVTVPVLTLLDADADGGVIDGVGPIDADTARRLAAEAPSFTRILTHPVTGAVLALDRTTYRVPTDLAKTLRHRDRTCRAPGCGRRASRCDVDHVVEWQDGGATEAGNLIHLCRHHHRLKSVARWRASPPNPMTAVVTWRSPTGHVVEAEPPPF